MNLPLRFHPLCRVFLAMAVAVAALGTAPIARAVDAPAKPVSAASQRQAAAKAVDTAVANLNKELAAFRKDSKTPLRTHSNYFTENKSADLTPEAILAALGRRQGSDGVSDSYIKWQLLSGIEQIEEKLASQGVAAYRSAAEPIPRPGLEAVDRRRLDQVIHNAGQNDAAAINTRFTADVDDVARANELILKYRDEFFAKLPQTAETLVAGFDDAVLRVNRGSSGEALGKKVLSGIRLWAAGAPPAQQLHAMAAVLRQQINQMGGLPPVKAAWAPPRPGGELIFASDVHLVAAKAPKPPAPAKPPFPPSYYASVEFDANTKQLKWTEESPKFLKLSELVDEYRALEEAANNPNAGLKFK